MIVTSKKCLVTFIQCKYPRGFLDTMNPMTRITEFKNNLSSILNFEKNFNLVWLYYVLITQLYIIFKYIPKIISDLQIKVLAQQNLKLVYINTLIYYSTEYVESINVYIKLNKAIFLCGLYSKMYWTVKHSNITKLDQIK